MQLEQLEKRSNLELHDGHRRSLGQTIQRLNDERSRASRAEEALRARFDSFRDRGIERFTPMLLQTVAKYEAALEDVVDVTFSCFRRDIDARAHPCSC